MSNTAWAAAASLLWLVASRPLQLRYSACHWSYKINKRNLAYTSDWLLLLLLLLGCAVLLLL